MILRVVQLHRSSQVDDVPKQEFASDPGLGDILAAWNKLRLYQRFEEIVALILQGCTCVVILVATWHLVVRIAELVKSGLIDPSNPKIFQSVFGMIMIVLIAFEFNHSLKGVFDRQRSSVQVRTVVLIALLAVLRKFIIFDVNSNDEWMLLALSAAALSLGAIYWALREQDRRRQRCCAGTGRRCGFEGDRACQPL
jgi:uncharacterized membrane protein (DUF373 family)